MKMSGYIAGAGAIRAYVPRSPQEGHTRPNIWRNAIPQHGAMSGMSGTLRPFWSRSLEGSSMTTNFRNTKRSAETTHLCEVARLGMELKRLGSRHSG
jgi:hypothetical protein